MRPVALRRALRVTLLTVAVTAACSGGHSPAPVRVPIPATVLPDAAAAAFCTQLIGMSQQLAGLLTGSAAAATPANFKALADLYAELERASPPAIKATVTDVVAGLREAADALGVAPRPDVAKLQDFAARATTDTQKLTTYTTDNCTNR